MGALARASNLLKLLLVVYVPLSFTLLPAPSAIHLVIGMTGAVLLANFLSEASAASGLRAAWNLALAVAAVIASAYFWSNVDRMTFPMGAPPTTDYLMGGVVLVTVLEASRQRLGAVLPGLAVLLALYILVGSYLPGALYHPGLSAQRLVFQLTGTLQGPYGQIPSVVVSIVTIFLVFGAVIQGAGVAQFFVTLGQWISRRVVSGSGLSAVTMSSLFGSISGSPIANAGTTGPLTIPLMKRSGYSSEEAAAIEGVASTGSQVIPPVLGTSAFIMAQLLNVPYSEIVAISTFPALLFIGALLLTVHAFGVKAGTTIVASEGDSPSWLKAYLLFPVVVLVAALMKGYSPQYAAFVATVATVLLFVLEQLMRRARGDQRARTSSLQRTAREFGEALVRGADSLIMVVIAGAVIGVIVDLITIPLTIQRVSTYALTLAGDNAVLVLIVIAVAALILGTGLPTVATYILVAMLFVPTLTALGISPIAGHMFVFYYGVVGDITPPVAMAVLIGTGIAGGSFWRACLVAMKLGFPLFLLPFLFVFHPGMMMPSLSMETLLLFTSIGVGVVSVVAAMTGYLFGHVGSVRRVLFLAVALLAWWPDATRWGLAVSAPFFLVLLAANWIPGSRGKRMIGQVNAAVPRRAE